MKDPSTGNRFSLSSWSDVRRLLELSPRHPAANLVLIALALVAAGWILQERVVGVPVGTESRLVLRALLTATPLAVTTAMVMLLRRK